MIKPTPEEVKELLNKIDFSKVTYALEAVNTAFALIGERPINGITPNGNYSQLSAFINYHPRRREVLCLKKWPGTVFTEKAEYNSWTRGYEIPTRALRILAVDGHGPNSNYFITVKRTVTLCGINKPQPESVAIEYIADEEDLDKLPTEFKKLFILKLARAFTPFDDIKTALDAVYEELSKEAS